MTGQRTLTVMVASTVRAPAPSIVMRYEVVCRGWFTKQSLRGDPPCRKYPGFPRTTTASVALKQNATTSPAGTSLALMDKSVKCGSGSVTVTVTDCEVVLA